jgi:glycosyltransferase involved in cell wall biosynthesis
MMGVDTTTGLVSVIIPTYNQVEFIDETINSVLSQNYSNIEIILTDDGSSDGTAEINNRYAASIPNVISITSARNTGIAANFNRALDLARGEFVAWLGGDDLMLPAKLKKQVNILNSNQFAVGCCHDAEVFRSEDGFVLGSFSQLMNGKKGLRSGGVELLFDANYFMLPSTMLVRRSAIPLHGFDTKLKYVNDWLMDVDIFVNGYCIALKETLGRYRRHVNNVTGNILARRESIKEGMVALDIVSARYPHLIKMVRKRKSAFYLTLATWSFIDGEMNHSLKYIYRSFLCGAFVKSLFVFLGLCLFGRYIKKQMELLAFQRSSFFKILSFFIKA